MSKFLKKAFTFGVVVTTIVWSIGLAAFVPTAQAVQAGDLIKASGAAVYYLGSDGKRYVFPDEKTFKTWYANFSSVITITDAELAALPIGGNVTYRPGVKMIKITTDPKVYAVDAHGNLRWIQTEAAAAALYGPNWNQMVQDVPDPFFVNYTIGAPIASAGDFNKDAVTAAASSINVDKMLGQVGPSSLSVSTASDNPAGATLPTGATGVRMLKIQVNGTGSINTLTVKDIGVGQTADIKGLYLYEGNTRLTTSRTLNSTTREATFTGNWTAPRSLTIVADIETIGGGATAAGQHIISVMNVNGSAVTGVSGNAFVLGNVDVGGATIAGTSAPSNPKVGQAGALIAEFKLTAGTNDTWVHGLTLTQSGSISVNELTNFVLKQGNTTVATASGITAGDKIVLTFSQPFSILSGQNRNFQLYADVTGRPGRTILVYLDEDSDLRVTDAKFGFGAGVTNTFTGSTITTEGGNVTIAFNGPVTGDVSKGVTDVVLYKFAVSAVAPIEVRNLNVKIAGQAAAHKVRSAGGTNYFSDIKVRNAANGQVLSGPFNYTATHVTNGESGAGNRDGALFTMPDDFIITGTMNLEIVAKIENTTSTELINRSYRVSLDNGAGAIFGTTDAKYTASNDFVQGSDIVPNTPIVGNFQTVRAASLSVGTSTFIGDSTHVRGAKDAQVVAFSLTAGSDSSVKVTKFIVDPRVDVDASGDFGDDDNANTVIASATLWKQGNDGSLTKLDGPRGVTGTTGNEKLTFENFSDTVPAGQSVLYIVSVDITTTAGDGNDDGLIITILSANNITAEDKDNNTVTPTSATSGNPIGQGNGDMINDNDGVAGISTDPANIEATVVAVGSLAVSVDTSDSQYRERLVQMGSTNQKALRVKARGTNEAFTLTDARITADVAGGGTAANVTSVSITYPTNAAQTSFETKTSAFVGGVAQFSGLNWYITKDTDSYLTVNANMNTDTNGASSVQGGDADRVRLAFEAQDADWAASPTRVKAVGVSSGTSVTTSGNADANGNYLRARKTVITINKHATSPSGTNVAPGVNDYLIFTIANSSGGTVTVSDLTFKATASDGAGKDWICATGSVDTYGIRVFDVDNPATNIVTATSQQDGTSGTQCDTSAAADVAYYTVTFGTPISISAGSTKTFKVQTDTSGASGANDDAFRLDIVPEVDGTTDDSDGTGTAVQWNDGINTLNGYKVENLPITGGNFSF